jgi:soluble lytic murein transglycosylase-like protein
MRKLPASEQPTQIIVREVTHEPHVARVTRQIPARRRFSWFWAGLLSLGLCGFVGFGLAIAARLVYFSLETQDNTLYEVVARQEPVTLASTTGEAAAKVPLSPIFTPEVQFWQPLIAEWALAWEIDPNLIATVIQIESCGDPFVSSSAGAQGLFQVMPFHFDPGEDMLDVQNNARRGMAYLNGGLDRSEGNAGLALAGYNGGHSVIPKGYAAWHSETRRYYYWGAGIYAEATAGLSVSPRLQEWLSNGGSSLCRRAQESQKSFQIQFVPPNS